MQKTYISPQLLLQRSYELAVQILESTFRPNWILAVWRGGAPVGMAVQEYLKVHGVPTDHIAIRTSSYHTIGEQSSQISVHGLEYVVKNANANDRLLIIDDIFDSGRSISAILDKLQRKMRLNLPQQIRVATVFFKPDNNKTLIIPDFYCQTTNAWIVFPHELEGLTREEIQEMKGDEMVSLMRV